MKKVIAITLMTMMALFAFSACNNTNPSGGTNHTLPEVDTPAAASNVLVAYFSCTGTTKGVAEHIAAKTDGTLYEIVPQIPYTEGDLKYYTDCRADREQNDPDARPEIKGTVSDMGTFDVVFLGYPIWHSQAPKIIYTFLESCDFSGKTIIPFCTSHSSGIGSSATNLHSLAAGATWLDGRRFSSGTSQSAVDEWVDSLELKFTPDVSVFDLGSGENGHAPAVTLSSGFEMPILGLGTYSLTGETCKASVKAALDVGVRLIDTAHMYGNEREIGEAIRESNVPREEIFVITKIYPGEQYSHPEEAIQESLDKLGIGYIDMMLLHHPGANDVKAYKAMEKAVADGKIRSLGLVAIPGSSNPVHILENISVFGFSLSSEEMNEIAALDRNEKHDWY